MAINITDLRSDDSAAVGKVAAILVAGIAAPDADAWPNVEAALTEVRESFEHGRIRRVARDAERAFLGWFGGIPAHRGQVRELHLMAKSLLHP